MNNYRFFNRGSPRGIDFHDMSGSQEDSPKNNVMLELRRREEELDRLISNAERELKQLTEDKRFAYVTYEDLRTIPSYKNQTVMVIKAPPEAKLRVPDPSKVSGDEGDAAEESAVKSCLSLQVLQMYIKSENSEIEVFICPEEVDDCPPAPATEKVKNSPVRPSGSHIGNYFSHIFYIYIYVEKLSAVF